METRRQEMIAAGEDVTTLPKVTALERSSGPGGVWRSSRTNGANDCIDEKKETKEVVEASSMYEGLWTNGPKESIEFFDYSYDEHFGHALPVYMPRQALLEYMLTRVTRKCPDFFEKYAQFNIDVQSVAWNEGTCKFDVVIRNTLTGNVVKETYDKCIWGAGDNGKQKIPHSMVNMFRKGGFTGRMIHSSDTTNFEEDVKGKRILLIGGSYSSEDLALTAIKVGAEMIYISSRQEDSIVTLTSAWPNNKVKLLLEMQPVQVTDEGKSIEFAEVERRHGDIFVVNNEVETKIRNIDTVIFCTGYLSNLDMLSDELRKPFNIDDDPFSCPIDVPQDWEMEETLLPEYLQGIKPGISLWGYSAVCYPDIYKWTLIDNPNMMYIFGEDSDQPILATDAIAWLLASFCTDRYSLPSPDEQRRLNRERALLEMASYPGIRVDMDSNFYNHVVSTWYHHPKDQQEKLWKGYYADAAAYNLCVYAQAMRDGQYPLDIGSIDGLNEAGKEITRMDSLCSGHRRSLDKTNEDENMWRTFRDIKDSAAFKSIITGTVAVPLKKPWIEIDDVNDKDILVPE
jgi:Flavin-binding monooxygenase-like